MEANLELYKLVDRIREKGFLSINNWKKIIELMSPNDDKLLPDLDNIDTSGMSKEGKKKLENASKCNKLIKKRTKKWEEDLFHIFSYLSDEELDFNEPSILFTQEKIELVSILTGIDIVIIKEYLCFFNDKSDFILSKGCYKGRGFGDRSYSTEKFLI